VNGCVSGAMALDRLLEHLPQGFAPVVGGRGWKDVAVATVVVSLCVVTVMAMDVLCVSPVAGQDGVDTSSYDA